TLIHHMSICDKVCIITPACVEIAPADQEAGPHCSPLLITDGGHSPGAGHNRLQFCQLHKSATWDHARAQIAVVFRGSKLGKASTLAATDLELGLHMPNLRRNKHTKDFPGRRFIRNQPKDFCQLTYES